MQKKLVYDVGMHNGDDTEYYLSQGYSVVAIEASPDLVKEGQNRFSQYIADGRLKIINIGVAAAEGMMKFYLNKKNSVWNSFDKEIGTREGADCEELDIKTQTITQVIRENGMPHYLKIDIEGNDIICLESLLTYPEKPEYISVEVNTIDLILKLKEIGYDKFKIIDQQSFLPYELPVLSEYRLFRKHKAFKHSKNFFIRIIRKLFGPLINKYYERRYKRFFTYDHPFGSSGPFGNQLPGKWMDFEETLLVYLYYKQAHKTSKWNRGYNYWIDIHASK